ncbi:MAG TPA: hypothetical protein VFB08_08750 [Burkholderiales bacterium]|nr:hypothetical protein [Burkholderiales bacterium]
MEAAAAVRPFVARTLLAILLLVNAGIPVNTLWQAAAVGVGLLIACTAEVRRNRSAIVAVAAVFLLSQLVGLLFPRPQWEEGHNFFAPNPQNVASVYAHGLPPLVLEAFVADYATANPDAAACSRSATMPWGMPAPCWSDLALPQGAFAKSADGLWRRGALSRPVDEIALGPEKRLSAGFLFDSRFVWATFSENPNKAPLSFYVAYALPRELEGSTLCWTGSLVWERPGAVEREAKRSSCRALVAGDVGARVWALQPNELQPLVLQLHPSVALAARLAAYRAWLVVSTCLLLLAGVRLRSLPWTPIAILGASAAIGYAAAPEFFGGLPGRAVNRDALLYLSWGRDILFDLLQGRVGDALRGGEDVYVFMPGMRYFRAAESALFGDSGFGYLLLICIVPVLLYRITKELAAGRTLFLAVALLSMTMMVKILRTAADGYGDPLGLFLVALSVLFFLKNVSALLDPEPPPNAGVGFGFLALGLAIVVRPNFVLAGILVALLWLCFRWRGQLASLKSAECLGLALVLLLPLHNLAFGHRFVPLTLASNLSDTLIAPPSAYFGAAGELLRLSPGDEFRRVAHHLLSWWLPARGLLFFGALAIALSPLASRGLRLLAAIAFALQAPHIFYRAGGREMMPATYLALVTLMAFVWQTCQTRAWPLRLRRWLSSGARR